MRMATLSRLTRNRCGVQLAIVLMAAAGFALSACADDPAGDAPAAVQTDQIHRWVNDLNAAEFKARNQATEQLITAGPAVLNAVTAALDDAGLEVKTRVIYILHQLGAEGDIETEDEVRGVLERLAAEQTSLAAERAVEALGALDIMRQEKSLRRLEKLGAIVNRQYQEPGVTPIGLSVFLVQLDENWTGTSEDLSLLRWLRDVQQVTFAGKQVTDEWLTHLRGMSQLQILKLAETRISDDGLARLKELPVRALLLQYMPVTDAAVEHLAACRRLTLLRAYGTRFTAAAEKAMTDRGVRVDRRRGAFLGVTVLRAQQGENWEIDRVTEGSAAELAGLKPGDVVVQYGDQPVRDFPELTAMIAKNDVGDTVTLKIRRRGKEIEKRITFGPWK